MTDATPPIDLATTIAKLRELAARTDIVFIAGCSPQTVAALCDAAARAEALKKTCIDNIAFHRKTVAALEEERDDARCYLESSQDDIRIRDDRIAALEAENARLQKALERIMDWRKPAEGWGEVAQICRIARAALTPQPTAAEKETTGQSPLKTVPEIRPLP